MKEWKVYFSGNFWGHEKGERRSKEIPVGKSFLWGGQKWLVPSIYTSEAGLAVDFCVEIAPERIRAFMDKWNFWEGETAAYEDAEYRQIEAENPLLVGIHPQAAVNGRELMNVRGCSVGWNPYIQEKNISDMEVAGEVLEHYGCDASKGWVFIRSTFRWATKRKPVIRDIRIKLEREPEYFAGRRFTAEEPGQKIVFTHPVTGTQHTLTVADIGQETLDNVPFEGDMEWPTHCVRMGYTLSPDLPGMEIFVQDCGVGDSPRPGRKKASALGVIGGANGATALFLAGKGEKNIHTAFSSMYFEAADTIEWRITFHIKRLEDITVSLF